MSETFTMRRVLPLAIISGFVVALLLALTSHSNLVALCGVMLQLVVAAALLRRCTARARVSRAAFVLLGVMLVAAMVSAYPRVIGRGVSTIALPPRLLLMDPRLDASRQTPSASVDRHSLRLELAAFALAGIAASFAIRRETAR